MPTEEKPEVENLISFFGSGASALTCMLSQGLDALIRAEASEKDLEALLRFAAIEKENLEGDLTIRYGHEYLHELVSKLIEVSCYGLPYELGLHIRLRCNDCGYSYYSMQVLKREERSSNPILHDSEYIEKYYPSRCNRPTETKGKKQRGVKICNSPNTSVIASSIMYNFAIKKSKKPAIVRVYSRIKSSGRLKDKLKRKLCDRIISMADDGLLLQQIKETELDQLRKEIAKEKDWIGDVYGVRIVCLNKDICYATSTALNNMKFLTVVHIDDYIANPKPLPTIKETKKGFAITGTNQKFEAIGVYVHYPKYDPNFPFHVQIMTEGTEHDEFYNPEIGRQSYYENKANGDRLRRELVEKVRDSAFLDRMDRFVDALFK